MGVQALGMGLGTLIQELGAGPDIVTGHDFRSYSMSIKLALISGLMAAGARVKDIGMALSPTAYYAQFALDCHTMIMVGQVLKWVVNAPSPLALSKWTSFATSFWLANGN